MLETGTGVQAERLESILKVENKWSMCVSAAAHSLHTRLGVGAAEVLPFRYEIIRL